ncbi:MAG: GTPase HflX, partial [Mycobacteriales bacterium]
MTDPYRDDTDDRLAEQGADLDASEIDLGGGFDVPDRSESDLLAGLALEQRQGLRRVHGLATELTDVTEVEYRRLRLERVVLIGVWTAGTLDDAQNSLAELKALAETAGSQVLDALMQRLVSPNAATFIGSGKARELRDIVVHTGADTVICDG